MKQPENEIKVHDAFEEGWLASPGCEIVSIFDTDQLNAVIACGTTKRAALRIAISRLHRLATDAERMLEKLKRTGE